MRKEEAMGELRMLPAQSVCCLYPDCSNTKLETINKCPQQYIQ